MEIVIEFVVKDIFNAAEFYTKYFGFEIEREQYDPVSWMQLKNGNTNYGDPITINFADVTTGTDAEGNDTWTYTITGLPKYINGKRGLVSGFVLAMEICTSTHNYIGI